MDLKRRIIYSAIASGGGKKPASQQDIIWRGRNGVKTGTDNVVNDTVGDLDDALYVGNNCLTSAGTTLLSAAFSSGDTVTNEGSATVGTVSNGSCAFGSGTISGIRINGVLTFTCAEGSGLPFNIVSESAPDITDIGTATWATSDTAPAYNIANGFASGVVSDGSGQYINLGITADSNTDFEVCGTWENDGAYEGSFAGSRFFMGRDDSSSARLGYGTFNQGGANIIDFSKPVRMRITGGKLYINDVEYLDSGSPPISSSGPLYVFARNFGGTADTFVSGRRDYIKVWQNSILVRHLIPVGDGTFKDLVDDTIYATVSGVLVAIRIPALLDGSSAADGNPLTNLPGYRHNGAESSVRQADAVMLGLTGDGTDTTWSDDGSTFADDSYADMRSHTNGSYGRWLKCVDINGVPHYSDDAQYAFGKEFTPGEVNKNESFFGDNCGTGQSALRDVDGELVTDVDGDVIFTS